MVVAQLGIQEGLAVAVAVVLVLVVTVVVTHSSGGGSSIVVRGRHCNRSYHGGNQKIK